MSTQDNKATILCVCSMIRLHMLEAERQGLEAHVDFDIYRDRSPSSASGQGLGDRERPTPTSAVSSQDDTVHHTHHQHQVSTISHYLCLSFSVIVTRNLHHQC